MELRRRRSVQTVLLYPVLDADGDAVTGLSFSPQISTWSDTNFPSTFLTIEAAAELGSSGWYLSTLSATQTAGDYLAFLASPTTAGTKRQHILLNMTAVASVTETGTVTNAATVGQLVDTTWNRVLTSSPTTAGAAGLMLAQVYATMSTGPLSTVTAVNYPVPLNWASISNAGSSQNFTQTRIASVNYPVPLLWSSISGQVAAVNLTGTQIASINNPVPINLASVTNPGIALNLTGTQIASVNYGVGVNWGSVTNPGAANNLTATRIASVNYSVGLNWGSITNAAAAQNFTGSQVATVDQVADLRTTVYPELSGEPLAASTALDRLGFIYALSLNKVQVSSVTQAIFSFAETATISVATHQDVAGVFTRNRWR